MADEGAFGGVDNPSMKVPPKRKGNQAKLATAMNSMPALNESPSEKEGKFR